MFPALEENGVIVVLTVSSSRLEKEGKKAEAVGSRWKEETVETSGDQWGRADGAGKGRGYREK